MSRYRVVRKTFQAPAKLSVRRAPSEPARLGLAKVASIAKGVIGAALLGAVQLARADVAGFSEPNHDFAHQLEPIYTRSNATLPFWGAVGVGSSIFLMAVGCTALVSLCCCGLIRGRRDPAPAGDSYELARFGRQLARAEWHRRDPEGRAGYSSVADC